TRNPEPGTRNPEPGTRNPPNPNMKYLWIAFTSIRSNLAYLTEVAARVIFLGVILFIFLQLWKLTFSETRAQQLGGFTLAQMLWYLAITESIILSGPRVSTEVDEDVRTGALAVQLIRPLSYPLYRLFSTLGERTVRFFLNATVAAVISLVFVGPISISLSGLAMFAVSIPLAFVLDFLGMFLIGLGAFWLEDTAGLTLIYSRITMILGGLLIPIELFPDAIQPIVRILPFASMVYGPAHMFVAPGWSQLIDLIIKQSLGIVVLGVIVSFVYQLALKRISAHGG
ncbi:MAG TPA: ABC-2 family transporter protein, partial [Acidobacteriota bacterium]|nr:ABC-2 family transporter protein [Acidobacteriota bacterium]HNG96211.1 ABC-2 family transporter protein [Acidobacteriota bacterium]HNH85239.1 ABC-2 family transporter protein [Acidobacteriota bacterium]